MNKTLSSLFRISVATVMVIVAGMGVALKQEPGIVRAVGDLQVIFPSDPVFNITNMAPGDVVPTKTITVKNNGTVARMVAVRADEIVRTPDGPPDLDDVLTLEIGGDAAVSFTNLKEFLDDSDGVLLGIINPGQIKNYDFDVTFPSSANNDFQDRSVVFNLIFGVIIGNNVVINEVFYNVDPTHGIDCNFGGGNSASVIGPTGPGSTNIVSVNVKNKCFINVKNTANVTTMVNAMLSTGGNTVANNTVAGSLISGNATVNININVNISQSGGIGALGQSDEWIELYNPTNQPINLKNWRIVDDSGIPRIIHRNAILPPGKFALLAKSARTFSRFWSVPPGTLIIKLGLPFGDGLGNAGDRVRLFSPQGQEIDQISWGTDLSGPAHFDDTVAPGHSIERLAPGFDTDSGGDFEDEFPPTPGFD
jgi:hypothetical protein